MIAAENATDAEEVGKTVLSTNVKVDWEVGVGAIDCCCDTCEEISTDF